MTLEKLNKDLVAAMKENDVAKKEVLRSAIGNIKKAAIDKKIGDNITEQLIDEVLLKEKKTLEEMVDTCPLDRTDLLSEYGYKLDIIKEYAPKLMVDEDEIKEYINYIIDNYDVDISNTSTAMKTIMPHLKGKADMKVANSVIRGMCF